jgi:hypothetical protein
MTLIEAAKTGKRFRRVIWVDMLGENYWYDPNNSDPVLELTLGDILADDYEIELYWSLADTIRYFADALRMKPRNKATKEAYQAALYHLSRESGGTFADTVD